MYRNFTVHKRVVVWLTLLLFVLIAGFLGSKFIPVVYGQNALQSITVFRHELLGHWTGAGDGKSIESYNAQLPVDFGETYNGLPSLRLHVSGSTGWWTALFANPHWEPYSLEPYLANGALSFNIKGDAGADLTVSVSDVASERDPEYCEPIRLQLSDYVTLSQEWQPVRIPAADLVGDRVCQNIDESSPYPGGLFKTTQLAYVVFSGGEEANFTVWLNDIAWKTTVSEPIVLPTQTVSPPLPTPVPSTSTPIPIQPTPIPVQPSPILEQRPAVITGAFIWPTTGRRITQGYKNGHKAVDIGVAIGTPVYASDGGTVAYANWHAPCFGNVIIITHGPGVRSYYAHLGSIGVAHGQNVSQGELIGYSGNTGCTSGAHLHFEIRKNRNEINPLSVLP